MSGAFPSPHLVLGGARSGKSVFAEALVESCESPRIYIATGEARDAEMARRIREHQRRRGPSWETLEVPVDLPGALLSLRGRGRPVLVDCLTLWLSNVMHDVSGGNDLPVFPTVAEALSALVRVVSTAGHPLVLVSNEVGLGIVPENALAREFRDLSGRMNQEVARVSRAVTFMAAGLPLPLKRPQGPSS